MARVEVRAAPAPAHGLAPQPLALISLGLDPAVLHRAVAGGVVLAGSGGVAAIPLQH
jgi:hypothetical protein